ncbi:SDR family NAD(P)-dependent oxidoreductase [Glaciecola siphonariae]|uniref:SDR family NAD(P)-dependent oxidoreductase n=1 Tax=Glaciecola siphonariae TaxID=521012 RepID=A0ABV9LX19_9ALTE
MSLKDKVVIVAGGGRDIGAACALELAKQGAKVLITYHASATGANEVLNKIASAGGDAIAIQADLTQAEHAQKTVDTALEKFGKIDSLVHVSGGLLARKKIEEMEESHWHKVLDLNLSSLFLMTKAVIPHLPEGGSIVTFSSQAARDGGGAGAVAYATSKGAITTFTRALAKELGPKVRVNAVCPGMISTQFHDDFTNDDVREKVANATAVKREGTAEEVANLVAFLVGPQSSYMTGTNIDINGGLLFS